MLNDKFSPILISVLFVSEIESMMVGSVLQQCGTIGEKHGVHKSQALV